MKNQKNLLVSVDVEADGPCPGLYSMVSFGCTVVEEALDRTFYGQTAPISQNWIPEALAVSGHTREEHLKFPKPEVTMLEFYDWLQSLGAERLTFISDNNCLKYSTRVITTEEFSFLPSYRKRNNTVEIYDIVKNKIDLPIPTYNLNTGVVEHKKIIGWIENRPESDWVRVSTDLNAKNSPSYTKDHLIYTKYGWKKAENLIAGDTTFQLDIQPNEDQKQLLLGSLLGDSSFGRKEPRGRTWNCSHSNYKLSEFKYNVLRTLTNGCGIAEIVNNRGFSKPDGRLYGIHTKTLRFLSDVDKKNPMSVIALLDTRGFAIWYADDGSLLKNGNTYSVRLHTEGFSKLDNERIADALFDRTGLSWKVVKAGRGNFLVTLSSKDSITFLEQIAPYLPRASSYKLIPRLRNKVESYNWNKDVVFECFERAVTNVEIVENKETKAYRARNYCIVVEDNHNFFTTTGLVHNCFDWQFINYYFHAFLGKNPFGFSSRRIGDIYAGITGRLNSHTEWKKYRKTKHDHNPVSDSKGNAEAILTFPKISRFQL